MGRARHALPFEDMPTEPLAIPLDAHWRRRRRWPLVAGLALLLTLGFVAGVLALRPDSAVAPVAAVDPVLAPSTGTSTAPPASAPARSTTRVPSASSSGGCPSSDALVAEYRRNGTSPTRTGAVAKGTATCAAGFAVQKVKSPGDSETVSAIFAVRPTVRFLQAGSGPICTDDPASMPGAVVVPRSAARALNCATTAAAVTSGTTDSPPTLGSVWSPNQQGFGGVRPREVNAGGDSTGIVEGISWSSWGGATAQGRGTGYWIGPDQASYQATAAPAVVVVDRFGTCHGHAAYLRVRWYFPTHGETAPIPGDGFADICGSS